MIKIEIEKQTRQVYLSNGYIGNDNENLQDTLEFSFKDEFVDGQARLELKFGDIGEKTFITLDKENETYTTPITNIMTVQGKVYAQLVVTEGTNENHIPIFKSNIFYFYVNESINAQTGDKEPYIEWIEKADVKLNQVENLDIDASKTGSTATITITKKDGTQEEVEIYDGQDGVNGQDGKSIEYNWSGTSLGIRQEGQADYSYTDLKGDKGDPGEVQIIVVNSLPQEGEEGTIYLVPITGETGNNYEEYIYINNVWEKLGGIQVQIDLTDYVKNTDYATSSKGGVILTSSSYGVDIHNGAIRGTSRSYEQYGNDSSRMFISKGTLENVITGKGLLDSSKVKSTASTTSGDVYDVTYINTMLGNIEQQLSEV